MAEPIQTLQTKVRGLWNPEHTISDSEGNRQGSLRVKRNIWGMVVSAEYRPEKGEVLTFRRDPGLLRAQFSLWTEGGEWLGSSLRWHVGRRQVDVWTGSKPYRVVPTVGPGRGWRVVATKTGEVAQIKPGFLSRGCKIELWRKIDPELLLFCYFLGSLTLSESLFPTALDRLEPEKPAATAARRA